MLTLLDGLA